MSRIQKAEQSKLIAMVPFTLVDWTAMNWDMQKGRIHLEVLSNVNRK
jgi:hypothetical protein